MVMGLKAKKIYRTILAEGSAEDEDDQQASGFIGLHLSEELTHITEGHDTAYSLWKALETRFAQRSHHRQQVLEPQLTTV